MSSMRFILAAPQEHGGGLYQLLFMGAMFLFILLGRWLKRQQPQQPQRRPRQQEEDRQEQSEEAAGQDEPTPPNPPPSPAPKGRTPPAQEGMSIEDIALAMRRNRRLTESHEREIQREILRQREIQQQREYRAAHQPAKVQSIQPTAVQPPQESQMQQPIIQRRRVSGSQAAPTAARRVSAGDSEHHQSLRQHHLEASDVGRGVRSEEARMLGVLREEDAERDHRLSSDRLGHLAPLGGIEQIATAAQAAAPAPVIGIELAEPAELIKGIIYSEILGKPLSLREPRGF